MFEKLKHYSFWYYLIVRNQHPGWGHKNVTVRFLLASAKKSLYWLIVKPKTKDKLLSSIRWLSTSPINCIHTFIILNKQISLRISTWTKTTTYQPIINNQLNYKSTYSQKQSQPTESQPTESQSSIIPKHNWITPLPISYKTLRTKRTT